MTLGERMYAALPNFKRPTEVVRDRSVRCAGTDVEKIRLTPSSPWVPVMITIWQYEREVG